MYNSNPLVSVCIVTYNAVEFIEDTILSVLNQNYNNIEIAISDDGSKDGTQEILLKYSAQFPEKLKINLNLINKGITKNSNDALRMCTGKYITLLGGDDLYLPDKISTQVTFMESNLNCKISYHNVEIFESSTGKRLGLYNSFTRSKPYNGDVSHLLKSGCFSSACSVMLRKSALPTHGFNEKYPVASDYALFVETLLSGGQINYIPKIMSKYRRHSNNITTSGSPLYKQTLRDTLNFLNDIIIDHPNLASYALEGIGTALRAMRKYNGTSYSNMLWNSFKLSPNEKSFIGLCLFFLSFGKIKI